MLAPKNLLVIMSDEHNPKVMGTAGHPLVQTPNLDRLAARGIRFTSAYTTSPICVPARAAFATGDVFDLLLRDGRVRAKTESVHADGPHLQEPTKP